MLRSITGSSNPDYKAVGFRLVMDVAPKSNLYETDCASMVFVVMI